MKHVPHMNKMIQIYIALAEYFDTSLMTRDAKLAAISGHHAKVIVI